FQSVVKNRLTLAPLLVKPPVGVPSHSVSHPSFRRNRKSSVPSPLKSPVPATVQSVVKKRLTLEPLLVNPPLEVPSHSVSQPSVRRSRKSPMPSPLKSPVPTTLQSVVKKMLALAPLLVKPPLAVPSQSVSQPLSLRNSMSSRPSPLKSPVPPTCQSLVKKMLALAPLLL